MKLLSLDIIYLKTETLKFKFDLRHYIKDCRIGNKIPQAFQNISKRINIYVIPNS